MKITVTFPPPMVSLDLSVEDFREMGRVVSEGNARISDIISDLTQNIIGKLNEIRERHG